MSVPRSSVGHSLPSDLSSACLATFNLVKTFAFLSCIVFWLQLGDALLETILPLVSFKSRLAKGGCCELLLRSRFRAFDLVAVRATEIQ